MTTLVRKPRALNLAEMSVLIIDDQPFFRVLLTEILRSLGIGHVSIAVDGEDGFTAFGDIRPDVVITDWMMPKLDGIEMTRRIRSLKDETLQQVPVILVTAKNERSQIEFARGAGVDEFILKPISAKSICDRLREVIERPRPFVTFEGYSGPCRRRREDPKFIGPYRRFSDPLEIDGDNAEILHQGLHSVFTVASSHVAGLLKGLSKSSANIRPIHLAVSEMQAVAEDMSDPQLERVCELLLGFIVLMNKSGKPSPTLIQTHLNAIDILLRTPTSQSKTRDQIVAGLEKTMKRPAAA